MKIDRKEKIILICQSNDIGIKDSVECFADRLFDIGFLTEICLKDKYANAYGVEIFLGEYCEEKICSRVLPFLSYEAAVSGNKIVVSSGGPFSTMECLEKLMPLFEREAELADGVVLSKEQPKVNEFSEETDVRIMSTNILAKRWDYSTWLGNVPPLGQRAEVLASVLATCVPDVIGMQESDQPWIELLPHYLERLKNEYGIDYKWLFTDYRERQTLTTILYRADKYELIEKGINNFSINDTPEHRDSTYNLRLVCWVMLVEKTNKNNNFILVNTHWGPEDFAGNLAEEAALVNSLNNRYGIPIFCTGDFNVKETSDEYFQFKELTGVQSMREVAMECGALTSMVSGLGKLGVQRQEGLYWIDHIFGLGNYSVLKYETVLGSSCFLSDHSPHIADIKFI